jgi:hypothetical protein
VKIIVRSRLAPGANCADLGGVGTRRELDEAPFSAYQVVHGRASRPSAAVNIGEFNVTGA